MPQRMTAGDARWTAIQTQRTTALMMKRTSQTSRHLSRRQILKATAGTAALLAAAKLNFPAGAFAQGAGPEVKAAKLGFIALTDASPLFVAKEKGIFAKYGMPDVEVQKQASWGTTRDNLVLGSEGNGIDGAHILSPMPYLISSGKVTQNNQPTPMYILARLNLNGQCISVSKEYSDIKVGLDTAPFKVALEKKKAGAKAIKAAMTFPGGTHELWDKHPEKSFGMRAAYVDKYPKAAKALLMAVMEAQQWCEQAENREETAAICAKRQWINCPVEDVTDRMKGKFDYGTGRVVENSPQQMRFWKDNASYPYQSHDLWFITEDIRWGKYEAGYDAKALIAKVNREDLWKEAAKELGVASSDIPVSTSRGKETFFDGKVFDPENPAAYLKSLTIKRVDV